MKRKYLQTIFMMLLLYAGSAMAQDRPSADDAKQKTMAAGQQTLNDGSFRLLWSKLNVDFRKVVKGVPYSAIALSEHTQTLSDGNQIIRKSSARYYRDSEGRIRTEQKLDNVGNWTATGNAPQLIMIADPVAGRSVTLDPANRTGRVNPYVSTAEAKTKPEPANKIGAPAKPTYAGAPAPAAVGAPGAPAAVGVPAAPAVVGVSAAPAAEPSSDRTKKESLGRQVIEGIEVQGTRTTTTIPAGEIGNTRPIEIVDESWYSPELQLRVMIVHRDPRSGESTFRLTNIARGEPAATLFEVPPDYNLLKGPQAKSIKTVPD